MPVSIEGRGSARRSPGLTCSILHEDEIPDLDEAVAIGVRAAGRPARNLGTVIVEDLRARAAGAGLAHGPEIVRRPDADDPLLGQAGDLFPQLGRFLVLGIDRDGQPVLGQREFLGDEVPGQLDRAILEIIAERKIAEHLEERVMPRRIADIFEVIVLAAGANAFLRRGRAAIGTFLGAGEDVLELHHPGIGEKKRRVVARDERRRGHDLVAVPVRNSRETQRECRSLALF